MTKREFLAGLRVALSGRLTTALITENLNYYDDYISTQMRMGRAEADVVRELGDPRLIAKSIAEANKYADTGENSRKDYQSAGEGYAGKGYYGGTYAENSAYGNGSGYKKKIFKMPGWLVALLVGLVFFLIMMVMFSLFSFFMPFILPILLVSLLVKFFRST